MTLAELRNEYSRGGLAEADAGDDPIGLAKQWLQAAWDAGVPDPHAMTLATATVHGQPSARIVLLKILDERGFAFFTSYDGRKARNLAMNPNAALVLFWAELQRQVRVEGKVERTSEAESDAYFAGRPRGSRLGAIASPQSEVIPDRAYLEARLAELEAMHPGNDIPRPTNWGGYRVVPDLIEFWQGRPNRLHDRLRFTRRHDGWIRERLGP